MVRERAHTGRVAAKWGACGYWKKGQDPRRLYLFAWQNSYSRLPEQRITVEVEPGGGGYGAHRRRKASD